MSDIVLQTKNLSHFYASGTPFEVSAIDDVNLSVNRGELVAIIGHTGSGKSTLVQHFNGILKPDKGNVYVDGKDIWANKTELRNARFKVGLCFQYPEYQLFESTVYRDISFGPRNMGLDETEIDKRVRTSAAYVGLSAEHLEKSPFELSGGEKRRVAIAGVMAMYPQVLVLDEPTAGLDPRGRDILHSLIKEYQQQTNSTVILVSHNMEDVARLANSVVVMNKSKIAMHGSVQQVFSQTQQLEKLGLSVPQVTKVFIGLKNRGLDVSSDVFTVEQGKLELLKLMSKGRSSR